jgi:ankyrin repeat protein
MTTNLHDAVEFGDVTEVRRLVAAGADVDEEWGEARMRPLHVAAGEGQVEVLIVLVELGANTDAKDVNGTTPLHHAAGNGQVEAVKVLAQLGADIAARTPHGDTPLQVSIRFGHHQVAQVLRELESTARAQQAAASERAQQAARQDITEKREAANREQAAQTKVRLAPSSPHIELHSVCSWVVSDASFLLHG